MEQDFDWPRELRHRQGAPYNLEGIDVLYDFKWSDYFRDGRMQFRNGKCLAQQVLRECPKSKTPALLLTDADGEQERSFESPTAFVLVVNFPRYLEQADANAAVSYLASRFGPGVTNLGQFSQLAVQSPEEVEAFLEQQLTARRIAAWAAEDPERMSDLQRIAGQSPNPPSPADALQALRALDSIDPDLASSLAELLDRCPSREVRLETLDSLTDSADGRKAAGAVLGRRAADRLRDARSAVAGYHRLLEEPGSSETTFQEFIEDNLWLLGLDYVHMRPGHDVPRGSLDFILERFDGFHDLLELKSPQDRIIEAPDAKDGLPPSASSFRLSSALANALAQIHVYRDILTAHTEILDTQYGLPHSRDPNVVIVIGRGELLPPHRAAVLRELNRSLHRVEVVPYDQLGHRASAILDSVQKYWAASPSRDAGAL